MSSDSLAGQASEIFLTGGTGFLGQHLRTALAERQRPVTLLVRKETKVDLRTNESVQRGDIVRKDSFDVSGHNTVFHLAAQTSIEQAVQNPAATWETNADGTCNLLEAARKAGVERFLFTSTASVYGEPEFLPIDENHPLNPAEPYGASKAAGDSLVRSYGNTYGISTTVLRLFNLFGPGQPAYNVVGTIVEQAVEGDTIELGNLSPSRDFIYVKDVVRAMMTLLETAPEGSTYNIGTGTDRTVQEMAEMVTDIVDHEVTIVSDETRERDEDIEIPRHVADPSKLRSLGWTPVYDVRDGLKETVQAFHTDR